MRRLTQEEVISEFRLVHGDKYDYSEVNYKGTDEKVTIICPKHGRFEQTPYQHKKGQGCPMCGIDKTASLHRFTTEDFIKKSKEVHGDFYDYSKVEYVNAQTKVCIICPEHGEFWQNPYNHMHGDRCKYCANPKDTKEEFVRKANIVHGNYYDYSKVEYMGSNVKVCITCPKHGDFWQTPSCHLSGRGCRKCSNERHSAPKRTTEQFIEEAKKIHGDKYIYDKTVYVGNRKYVTITCPIHGDFKQLAQSHLSGCGCNECAKEEKRKSKEQFVEDAKRVHGDRYGYDKVDYTDCREKVCITCEKHGDFWQSANAHLQGQGCPECAHEEYSESKKTPLADMIAMFNDVHGNTYDYSLINKETYKNFHTPVPIICKEHGVFNQKPTLHAKGMGCPQCKKSLGENRVKRFLDNSHFLYIQQYKILNENLFCQQKKMFVDFYLPQQNVIIEFNGAQHYVSVDYFGGDKTFERQQNRDLALRQYCEEHKIKLIEIPYTEINNIETILKKELKTK